MLKWNKTLQIGEDLSIVSAEGATGEYGRAYITYHLSYDRDGSGGSFTMQGRGYVDADTVFAGSGAGMWTRDGHLLRMSHPYLDIPEDLQFLEISGGK